MAPRVSEATSGAVVTPIASLTDFPARRAARDLGVRLDAATGLGDDVARRELRVLLPHLRRLLRDQVRRLVDARSAGGGAEGAAKRSAPRGDREEGDDAQHGRLRGLGGARHALGAANLQVDAAAEGEEHAEGKVVLRTLKLCMSQHWLVALW